MTHARDLVGDWRSDSVNALAFSLEKLESLSRWRLPSPRSSRFYAVRAGVSRDAGRGLNPALSALAEFFNQLASALFVKEEEVRRVHDSPGCSVFLFPLSIRVAILTLDVPYRGFFRSGSEEDDWCQRDGQTHGHAE